MAEAETITFGMRPRLAFNCSQSITRSPVTLTRESISRSFCASLQRLAAIGSPARLTMASGGVSTKSSTERRMSLPSGRRSRTSSGDRETTSS